jgi:hypothetical protein
VIPETLPGDFAVVGEKGVVDRVISGVESEDATGDPVYDHSFVIVGRSGQIVDTLTTVRLGNLSDYAGCRVLIGRYVYLDERGRRAGIDSVMNDLGKVYPFYRLFLDLFHLGRLVHGDGEVCSERTVKYLWNATRIPAFKDPYGWTPADIAGVIEHWRDFSPVFKGVFSK